ncbi:tripartite tricarboxylate transporter substrate binding protein [Verticiella sediminum]|uniref:Tripartite tricarboxylate transporter substrate binding protein n=1 Tax=Verticiella sediminum TaxID=1247510 RepID=A0A556B197_9BURK|nr:tripartite tricarboxylate transporter substrate binding protein [Verticiella sediminum]TSH98966.1 tripartite tricarboxylate transporter substrate binding protein [Verticiella sediminum]
MTMHRRDFIRGTLAAGLFCSAGIERLAHAREAAWPSHPVRFVVPFAPGGGADIATRLMTEQLRAAWGGVTAIVDNKPGANTILAANAVLNAPRDGSTFLATISLTTQLPYLLPQEKVPFDPSSDFVPVAAITTEQLVLVTNPGSGVKSFGELVEAARKQPGKFAFGSYGIGSNSHLVLVEINKAAGVEMIHVPYKGTAPAVQAALSGEVAIALSNLGTVRQYIEAGRLVPLAVTGDKRYRFVPDVPTLAEVGVPGFETPAWIGVFAAKGVPTPIIEKLGSDIQAAVQTPELVAKLNDFGQEAGRMTTPEFQALVKRDSENAGRMIGAAGVHLQ